jgi:hypothetical protein
MTHLTLCPLQTTQLVSLRLAYLSELDTVHIFGLVGLCIFSRYASMKCLRE